MERATEHGTDAEAVSPWLWQQLPPELTERVIGFLSINEVPCTIRLLNKAAAKQFGGPRHTSINLSQPVPQHALAHFWAREDAVRGLSVRQRRKMLNLTAASGSVAIMRLALTRVECAPSTHLLAAAAGARQRAMCEWLREAGCQWSAIVMEAAAATGDLAFCQWLASEGCQPDDISLTAAARGGHLPLCEWLLANGCVLRMSAARAAAEGGHVVLLEWLLDRMPDYRDNEAGALLASAASGCDLPTLQLLFERYEPLLSPEPFAVAPPFAIVYDVLHLPPPPHAQQQQPQQPQQQHQQPPPPPPQQQQQLLHQHNNGAHAISGWAQSRIMAGALCSTTPDWREKVLWLLSRGFSPRVDSWHRAVFRPTWLDHLPWLREVGFELAPRMALAAVRSGNEAALEYLHGEGGVELSWGMARHMAHEAVRCGRLRVLQALHARGHLLGPEGEGAVDAEARHRYMQVAAARGHVEVLRWLVETLEPAPQAPMPQAAEVGDAAAVGGAVGGAVDAGGEGAVAPVELPSSLAIAAAGAGKLQALVWLRRRGCAWDEAAFAAAAEWGSEEMLEWMAAEGCPMGNHGEPYVRAGRSGDLVILRCLRRLGCPFHRAGGTFTRAVGCGCGLPVLRWLLAGGCPVDWARALKEARSGWRKEAEIVAWLQEQRRAAGLLGGGYIWMPRGAAGWCDRLMAAAAARVRRVRGALVAMAKAPRRRGQ